MRFLPLCIVTLLILYTVFYLTRRTYAIGAAEIGDDVAGNVRGKSSGKGDKAPCGKPVETRSNIKGRQGQLRRNSRGPETAQSSHLSQQATLEDPLVLSEISSSSVDDILGESFLYDVELDDEDEDYEVHSKAPKDKVLPYTEELEDEEALENFGSPSQPSAPSPQPTEPKEVTKTFTTSKPATSAEESPIPRLAGRGVTTLDISTPNTSQHQSFDYNFAGNAIRLIVPKKGVTVKRLVDGTEEIWTPSSGEEFKHVDAYLNQDYEPKLVLLLVEGSSGMLRKSYAKNENKWEECKNYYEAIGKLNIQTKRESYFDIDISADKDTEDCTVFEVELLGIPTHSYFPKPGHFATGVRDGKASIWKGNNVSDRCISSIINTNGDKKVLELTVVENGSRVCKFFEKNGTEWKDITEKDFNGKVNGMKNGVTSQSAKDAPKASQGSSNPTSKSNTTPRQKRVYYVGAPKQQSHSPIGNIEFFVLVNGIPSTMDNLEFQSFINKITENVKFCKVLYNFFNGSALSIGIVEFDDISSCTTFLNKSKFQCVPMPLDIYNALKACKYYREGVIYEDVVKLICKLFSVPYHSNKLKSGLSADLSDEFLMEIEFEKVQGEMIKNGDFAIAAKLFPWFNISLLSLAGNYKRTFVKTMDSDMHKNLAFVSVDNSPARSMDKRNDIKSPSKHTTRDDSSKKRKKDEDFSHKKGKEEESLKRREEKKKSADEGSSSKKKVKRSEVEDKKKIKDRHSEHSKRSESKDRYRDDSRDKHRSSSSKDVYPDSREKHYGEDKRDMDRLKDKKYRKDLESRSRRSESSKDGKSSRSDKKSSGSTDKVKRARSKERPSKRKEDKDRNVKENEEKVPFKDSKKDEKKEPRKEERQKDIKLNKDFKSPFADVIRHSRDSEMKTDSTPKDNVEKDRRDVNNKKSGENVTDCKQITIKNSLDEPKKLLHPDLSKDLDSIRESKVRRLKLERKLRKASEKVSKRSKRVLLDKPEFKRRR
ncbi:hypothetical protein BEWA_000660 [Theileria equi strain WA]|uniref:Uncharacterized protein n=1 Tax=Theileria equi strain WA TaxID=1537102 RepID=L0B072_THEEQ|nr:hypothetical protein BEWA_000660 [Theileria equi strain WA]AFZ80661.1 hypothetical protein BEWA_000660 [Theileria equi strain WA]|eukprot:XP_004830327.1 hypothetical protein BEWA_000660 [Theileria equi strain WA]